jgi:1,4-dihydroxy-2-naphthoyl-CoA hydrolase
VTSPSLQFDHFDAEWAAKATARKLTHGIDAYLGIGIESFTPGRLVAGFDVRDELLTMIGNMHGGCISALVDHCLGVVMYPIMPPGSWAATTEFKINLLAPVTTGRVTCTAEVCSMSRRLAVIRIEVVNEGRVVALAQGTSTIVAPKAGTS